LRGIVGEGGVFLALLVHFFNVGARSFPGRKLINGTEENLEVHHIFPRAALDRYPERDNESGPDRLGNLTLLARSDNEHLGDTNPDKYLCDVADAEKSAHLIPEDPSLWPIDKFKRFCEERESQLASSIRRLLVDLGVQ
jgi:hypothetical protein